MHQGRNLFLLFKGTEHQSSEGIPHHEGYAHLWLTNSHGLVWNQKILM